MASEKEAAGSHLVQEVERLREEEVRVDEDDLDLLQKAGLGNRVQNNAVPGDERGREDRVLLLLSFREQAVRDKQRRQSAIQAALGTRQSSVR